jgi:3-dehydroquinate synthase
MALDIIYSVRKGYLSQSTADRILRLLEALGFQLWSERLLGENDFGDAAILTGIQEFREHLGGRLHITLLRDIGQPFEAHEMDDDLVLQAIAALRQRAAAREDCLTLTRRFAPPSP